MNDVASSPTTVLASSAIQGAFFFVSLGATLSISTSTMTAGLTQYGGAVYVNGLSSVSIYKSSFTSNQAYKQGGAIYASGFQLVNITYTNFTNNAAYEYGSEYYAVFSNEITYLSNVIVTGSYPVSSIYCDTVSLVVSALKIYANTGIAATGGGITCTNCASIKISSSLFYGLQATEGGAIYIYSDESTKDKVYSTHYSVSFHSYHMCVCV